MEMEGDPKWWRLLHGRRGDLYRSPERDLPPLQGYRRLGKVTQAKAWAKLPWPFGPPHISVIARKRLSLSPFSVFPSTQFKLFFYFRECVDRSL
jgi:hypothetical protein